MYHYIVLPGNPPAKYFYELWKKEILQKKPNISIEIHQYENLDDQLDPNSFMEKTIENILTQVKNSHSHEIVLIGHSFGGFIAKQIHEFIPDKIIHTYLIFPFLGNLSLRAKLILNLTEKIHQKKLMKEILKKNKSRMHKIFDGLDKVTFSELDYALKLASKEKVFFQGQSYTGFSHDKLENMTLIYNPKDIWCPEKTINNLRQKINSQYVKIDHDFITKSNQRLLMSDIIFN